MIVVAVAILAVSTLSIPVALSEVPGHGPFSFRVSFPVCFSSLCLNFSFSAKSEEYWKAFVIFFFWKNLSEVDLNPVFICFLMFGRNNEFAFLSFLCAVVIKGAREGGTVVLENPENVAKVSKDIGVLSVCTSS